MNDSNMHFQEAHRSCQWVCGYLAHRASVVNMTVYTPFCTTPTRLWQIKPRRFIESKWICRVGPGRTGLVTRIRMKFIDYWLTQLLETITVTLDPITGSGRPHGGMNRPSQCGVDPEVTERPPEAQDKTPGQNRCPGCAR